MTDFDIANFDDLASEKLIVPEWNNTEIVVKELTGTDRDTYETFLSENRREDGTVKFIGIRGLLSYLACYKTDGTKLFESAEQAGKKSARALDRIYDVVIRLNALGQEQASKN